ncbi:MAG: thioredoxin domain-containing protein, partial [Bacteroidota bacterium]
ADSEGEEGKFYVWTEAELANVLMDPMHLELAKSYYSTTSIGNWEHGTNILHVNQDPADFAAEQDMFITQLFDQIDEINDQLLMARSDRVRPGLDDKTLTSWNALMIQGYVDAYQAIGKKEYLQIAEMKAHFLLREQLSNEGRLNRNYKAGRSSINGFLDDYALVIQALLSLYEVTFDESWVNVSTEIMDYAIAHFMDDKTSMFFYTSDLDPALVARKKELSDNVIPASNSVMARVLQHLGELTYNKAYLDLSAQMLANMWPTIREQQQPSFYSNWMQLLLGQVHPPYEVAIMGDQSVPLAHEMMTEYRPDVMYLGSYNESVLPLLENKFVPDQTVIYVCQNKVCKFPVETISQAKELMNDEDR